MFSDKEQYMMSFTYMKIGPASGLGQIFYYLDAIVMDLTFGTSTGWTFMDPMLHRHVNKYASHYYIF